METVQKIKDEGDEYEQEDEDQTLLLNLMLAGAPLSHLDHDVGDDIASFIAAVGSVAQVAVHLPQL